MQNNQAFQLKNIERNQTAFSITILTKMILMKLQISGSQEMVILLGRGFQVTHQ